MTFAPRLRRVLLDPLSWAGYLTWGAVALETWYASRAWAPVGGVSARTVACVLLAVFLLAFVVRNVPEDSRRTWPDVALLAMAAATVALLFLGPSSTVPVLLIVVAGGAVAALRPRAAAFMMVLLNLAFLAILVGIRHVDGPLVRVAIYGGFQLFAAFTLLERHRARRASADLRRVNAELLATRSLLAESARDGERLRVSRELHDVTGHKLTALAVNLELLGQEPAIAARREFGVVRTLATELLADVRQVVSRLRRDDGLDLRDALARVAAPFPRPAVHLELAGEARAADAERAQTLVRVAQEGLTNAARHSGADNVWVTLDAEPGALRLAIEDDGPFRGELRAGHGLTGLRERVEELGGRVELGRGPRGGLRVVAWVPQGQAT